jgi:hypothetical protein
MTIVLNGTTGITNDGGYTGDGVVFADTTPANTLVTTTGGNVGVGTAFPTTVARASFGNSSAGGQNLWAAYFATNSDTASAAPNFGLAIGWNRSGGGGESNIVYGTGLGSSAGLAFSSSDGTTVTERARIDSSGNLLVGRTTNASTASRAVFDGGGSFNAISCIRPGTGFQTQIEFFNGNGGVGFISTNGTGTSYVTSSDYRLKENIAPMTGALATVAALKPVTYKWKADGSDGQGFIAHELQAVVPECVTGEKDAVNEDGSIKPQGIDTSFLVATLTAALQEAHGLIKDLQSRVDALEAK